MTLTLNENCESILIESEYFNSDNQSMTLSVTYNCTTAYTDIEIDVEETDYTLDPTALSLDADELVDGIYYIVLVTVQEDGSTITESACKFVNCGTTCDMLSVFTAVAEGGTEEEINRALAFYALTLSDACTSCACADLCTLYNTATQTTCNNDNPCGCN